MFVSLAVSHSLPALPLAYFHTFDVRETVTQLLSAFTWACQIGECRRLDEKFAETSHRVAAAGVD